MDPEFPVRQAKVLVMGRKRDKEDWEARIQVRQRFTCSSDMIDLLI